MAKNKARDDRFFSCSQDHEFKYVSGLTLKNRKYIISLKENVRRVLLNI